MAKQKAELTAAQKATVAARAKVETARKANTDKPSDATKAALASAETQLKQCIHTENRERFVRVGGGRVKKARAAIRNFGNVASPRSYVYSEADIALAETALHDEVKKVIARMRASLTKGGTAKAEDDFSFG